jgi:hypothetical protein
MCNLRHNFPGVDGVPTIRTSRCPSARWKGLEGATPARACLYSFLHCWSFIYIHPDDFLPFLPSAFGEDGVGATNAGLMTSQQFEQYGTTIKDTTGAWGGEPEILALSRAHNVPIHVVQGVVPRIVEHNPGPSPQFFAKIARISYRRRMHGLWEVCFLHSGHVTSR